MSSYRNNLPQLNSQIFLTDGGIETTLIFHDGFDLPEFAAFTLLNQAEGVKALRRYYKKYAEVAQKRGLGFILEAPTWRASQHWAEKLAYSPAELAMANQDAIALMAEIRNQFETATSPMVISGCIGPAGDGYTINEMMTIAEAAYYHTQQITTFRDTEADMVTALTMTYVEEAIGLTQAAQAAGMPVVISFTVETDGNLPSGQSLAEAIRDVDAATNNGPIYYMINCAHPTHFDRLMSSPASWLSRIGGLRANASALSHAELDEADELDDGNPVELGGQYNSLRQTMRGLKVLGGCCGTDHRHIEAMAEACQHDIAVA